MSQLAKTEKKAFILYTLIANFAASKFIYNVPVSNSILAQYQELEYKVEQELEACLDEYIPATITLPEKGRVNSLKSTIVLRRILNETDIAYQKELIPLLVKNYPKYVTDIKVLCKKDEDDLSLSDCETDCDSYFTDYNLRDFAILAFMTSDYFGEKYQIDVKSLNSYIIKEIKNMTTDFMSTPNAMAVKETLSPMKFSMDKKSMKDYADSWHYIYREHSYDSSNKIYIDPFYAFDFVAMGSGIAPEDIIDTAAITRSDNLYTAYATLMSLRHRRDGIDTPLDSESTSNARTEQLITITFLFNLINKLVCDKYTAEVKTSIRKSLSKMPIDITPTRQLDDTVRYKKLQKENDRLSSEVKSLRKQNQDTTNVLFSTKKREGVLREKVEALNAENIRLKDFVPVAECEEQAENKLVEPKQIDLCVDGEPMELDIASTLNELNAIFDNKKIVFVGGNEKLMKKIRAKYPKAIILEESRIASSDTVIKNADAVMFKTDSVSHSLYAKCKQLADNSRVPIAYINDVSSVELIEKQIKEKLDIIWNIQEGGS